MPLNHVLRVKRSDAAAGADYVIVNAITESNVGASVDIQSITLEATEGEMPYFEEFTRSKIISARDSKSSLTHNQWEWIVLKSLSPRLAFQVTPSDSEEGLETSVTASISSGALWLRFQHVLPGGFTQHLGTLSLPATEDHEINFMHWASSAVLYAEALAEQSKKVKDEQETFENAIKAMEAKVDELIREKNESERKVLGACCELLNMKKAKVRGLMRILEHGAAGYELRRVADDKKVKPESDGNDSLETNMEDGEPKSRQARGSRNGKRKQGKQQEGVGELLDEVLESGSDGGFDEIRGRTTPNRTDDYTTDSDEDEPTSQKKEIGLLGGKKTSSGSSATRADLMFVGKRSTGGRITMPSTSVSSEAIISARTKNSPPPRRELAFGTKGREPIEEYRKDTTMQDRSKRTGGSANDEDDTSDDEL